MVRVANEFIGRHFEAKTSAPVDNFLRRLRRSIDYAMNASLREGQAEKPRFRPFVAHISFVKGVPFYGFHVGWKFYCKIYLFNPRFIGRLSNILQNGAVMHRVFQPHESHIQYILQFMIDYNLHGCGFVECEKVRFRREIPEMESTGDEHIWHDMSIPEESILPEVEFPRHSYCSLEVDIQVQDILNRKEVSARLLHHDFVERTNPIPPDVKLVHSMAELWKDENRRRGSQEQPAEGLASSLDPRGLDGSWIHEEQYREKIRDLIRAEGRASDGHTVRFETFVRSVPYERLVPTTFESVADFFSSRDIPRARPGVDGEGDETDVDEDLILDMGDISFSESDDEKPNGLHDLGTGTSRKRPAEELDSDESFHELTIWDDAFMKPQDTVSPNVPASVYRPVKRIKLDATPAISDKLSPPACETAMPLILEQAEGDQKRLASPIASPLNNTSQISTVPSSSGCKSPNNYHSSKVLY